DPVRRRRDFGDSRRCISRGNLVEFAAHHFIETGAVAEDFEKLADGRGKLAKLARDFVAADSRQTMQAKLENSADLRFTQAIGVAADSCLDRLDERDVRRNL